MPRFHLTFDYPDRLGAKVATETVVIADSLESAAEYIASQRGLASIHVRRRILPDGVEMIDRRFTFAPSDKSEAA